MARSGYSLIDSHRRGKRAAAARRLRWSLLLLFSIGSISLLLVYRSLHRSAPVVNDAPEQSASVPDTSVVAAAVVGVNSGNTFRLARLDAQGVAQDIAQGSGSVTHLLLSADGKTIAFAALQSGTTVLQTVQVAGGAPATAATADTLAGFAISGDGKRVVYHEASAAGATMPLYVVDLEKNTHALLATDARDPIWSGNSTVLLVKVRAEDWLVQFVDAGTQAVLAQQRFEQAVRYPVFGQSTKSVYFFAEADGGGVAVYRWREGQPVAAVATIAGRALGEVAGASLAPDEQMLMVRFNDALPVAVDVQQGAMIDVAASAAHLAWQGNGRQMLFLDDAGISQAQDPTQPPAVWSTGRWSLLATRVPVQGISSVVVAAATSAISAAPATEAVLGATTSAAPASISGTYVFSLRGDFNNDGTADFCIGTQPTPGMTQVTVRDAQGATIFQTSIAGLVSAARLEQKDGQPQIRLMLPDNQSAIIVWDGSNFQQQ